ncbi:hypothetical protein LCGC14_1506170 [marine sediment metagenome]|uniref:LexA repressor DNA-binding domain-containing protein n=1 Tax=marine sediment metagenome TaxID=412755 RepID=A0A0F9M419_9ZZZZ
MKPTKKTTPRERLIYQAIFVHNDLHQEMPTYQEIADRVERSRTTVFEQVSSLINKGFLTSQGTLRGLEFTNKIPN